MRFPAGIEASVPMSGHTKDLISMAWALLLLPRSVVGWRIDDGREENGWSGGSD
jgi:hypothetical protein